MECPKCKKEVSNDSKFCSSCGQKIEEESILSLANRGIDMTRKTWYVVGLLRGQGITNGKKKKWLKEIEDNIKKIPDFYEEYENTVNYWREVIKNNKLKNGKKLSHPSTD